MDNQYTIKYEYGEWSSWCILKNFNRVDKIHIFQHDESVKDECVHAIIKGSTVHIKSPLNCKLFNSDENEIVITYDDSADVDVIVNFSADVLIMNNVVELKNTNQHSSCLLCADVGFANKSYKPHRIHINLLKRLKELSEREVYRNEKED